MGFAIGSSRRPSGPASAARARRLCRLRVNEVSTVSLRSTCSSWYVGANIPGRPRVFMPYIGGFPIYVQKCNEVAANGYQGFALT